ncbi:cell wall protein RBR3-like [Cucumis melo var. makuwa]|uniref:Cell wall protein RBR3-like n=1 Tax=Cucumis melo var. makuwa TaxID=1194695 RepID=A0A5A7VC15_CUCMM|nr:cell wall protein RBR3-like [Cucumis melo var. makuwa]TYK05165.1 cell wall protein RBR3-like [Cucumis melo var. makuwa]
MASNVLVPPLPLDGVYFHSEKNASFWKYALRRKIFPKKKLSDRAQDCLEIIKRVYCEPDPSFDDVGSADYKRLHVRGHDFVFTASVINKFLDPDVPLKFKSLCFHERACNRINGSARLAITAQLFPCLHCSKLKNVLRSIGGNRLVLALALSISATSCFKLIMPVILVCRRLLSQMLTLQVLTLSPQVLVSASYTL